MSTTTITTENKVLATDGATLTGDQVIAAVEEILMGEGIGVWQMVARPNQVNGSTFTYKLPERLIPQAYERSSTGASVKGNGPVVTQKDIITDQENIIPVEFEDMAFATQTLADQEKARIVGSMISAINGHLDVEFFNMLNGVTAEAVIGMSVATTQDALATARIKLGQQVAEIEGTVGKHELGVSAKREILFLSPKAYWNYINSFDTNVVEQSNEVRVGDLAVRRINGAIVVKHPLIGKDFTAGDIHKTIGSTMGTDKIEGFIMVDVAAAMPVNFIKTVTRVNENFNQEIATKYKFGKDILRDKLIVKIKSA